LEVTRQPREPRLSDVAERAGVSPTTVSRVLNHRGYLSQTTKDRVAQAITELGYRPNQVARSLLGQRTNMIGVIMPTVSLPFFGEVVATLEHALGRHGYRTLLCNSMGRAEAESEYLAQLLGNRVDGIISGAHNDSIPTYATTRLPVVTIDRELAPHIPNFRADNVAGGRLATELLLERGARRPALFTSRSSARNGRERGYRAVLADAGIPPIVSTVEFHTPEPERTRLIHAALDQHAGEIDAVFATDDLTAGTVLEWVRGTGRRVPEAFKVVGFDGTEAIRRAMPWLTTVRQPIEQICLSAVDALLERIEQGVPQGGGPDDGSAPVPPMEFPVTLVEGATA